MFVFLSFYHTVAATRLKGWCGRSFYHTVAATRLKGGWGTVIFYHTVAATRLNPMKIFIFHLILPYDRRYAA